MPRIRRGAPNAASPRASPRRRRRDARHHQRVRPDARLLPLVVCPLSVPFAAAAPRATPRAGITQLLRVALIERIRALVDYIRHGPPVARRPRAHPPLPLTAAPSPATIPHTGTTGLSALPSARAALRPSVGFADASASRIQSPTPSGVLCTGDARFTHRDGFVRQSARGLPCLSFGDPTNNSPSSSPPPPTRRLRPPRPARGRPAVG